MPTCSPWGQPAPASSSSSSTALETEGQCCPPFLGLAHGQPRRAWCNIYFDLRNGGISAVQSPSPKCAPQQPGPRRRPIPVPAAIGAHHSALRTGPNRPWRRPPAVQLLDMHGERWFPVHGPAGPRHQSTLQTARLSAGVYLFKFDSQRLVAAPAAHHGVTCIPATMTIFDVYLRHMRLGIRRSRVC